MLLNIDKLLWNIVLMLMFFSDNNDFCGESETLRRVLWQIIEKTVIGPESCIFTTHGMLCWNISLTYPLSVFLHLRWQYSENLVTASVVDICNQFSDISAIMYCNDTYLLMVIRFLLISIYFRFHKLHS